MSTSGLQLENFSEEGRGGTVVMHCEIRRDDGLIWDKSKLTADIPGGTTVLGGGGDALLHPPLNETLYLTIGGSCIIYSDTSLLLVHLCRAEAKLLEETARPLIDTLGEVTY